MLVVNGFIAIPGSPSPVKMLWVARMPWIVVSILLQQQAWLRPVCCWTFRNNRNSSNTTISVIASLRPSWVRLPLIQTRINESMVGGVEIHWVLKNALFRFLQRGKKEVVALPQPNLKEKIEGGQSNAYKSSCESMAVTGRTYSFRIIGHFAGSDFPGGWNSKWNVPTPVLCSRCVPALYLDSERAISSATLLPFAPPFVDTWLKTW